MSYLWTLPLVGAFVGYCTNWLAVRMLFYPHKPVKVFFVTFQGLIPRRRKELAECVAQTIQEELFGVEDIKAALANPKMVKRLEFEIDLRLHKMMSTSEVFPEFVHSMLTPKVRDAMSRAISERIAHIFLDSLQGTLSGMDDVLDIKAIVEERINHFDIRHINDIMEYMCSTGFKQIEILGAVLGATIGGVQWLLISLLV